MRFALAFLLILSAIGAAQTSPPPRNGAKQQQGSDNKAGHSQPLPNAAVPTAEKQPSPANEKQSTQEESECILKKAFAPETWATWALFIAAIWAGVIALSTLKAIQREAGEIKGVADSAAKNADALMLGDRAWLLIKEEKIQDPYLVAAEIDATHFTHCIFHLKNFGKTPARVVSEKYEMQIGDNRGAPPQPDRLYGLVIDPARSPYMIPQNKSTPREAPLISGFISQQELDLVSQKHLKMLWLCGFIRYRDVFGGEDGKEHETRFCYLWETHMNTPKPFWHAAGPAEYNQTT